MEEDDVLELFDLLWFRRLILRRNSKLPAEESPTIIANSETTESPPLDPPPSALLLRRHRRSRSDELAPSSDLRITPKLQTILSGKIAAEDAARIGWSRGRDRRVEKKRKGGSKSLTDLEFRELKGFIDLGFTFSDAEAADPRLISIVPGLQRLRAAATSADGGDSLIAASSSASEAAEEFVVSRPYLSEAWETTERGERGRDLLRNWRIPASGEGIDMKDHLRIWAHAVASAVR